jgi:hypothetical protein
MTHLIVVALNNYLLSLTAEVPEVGLSKQSGGCSKVRYGSRHSFFADISRKPSRLSNLITSSSCVNLIFFAIAKTSGRTFRSYPSSP